MTEQTITHNKSFGHSDLYLDFIAKASKLDKYIISSGPAETAGKIGPPRVDRAQLCDIVEKQNRDFGSKPLTFENINKLRREDAVCIFSGQQAGLLGGPLLTLYKMADVVKRAAHLEKELRRPVVPMFWIACDDHDFQEINHTFTIDKAGKLARIQYMADGENESPVAEIRFSEGEEYDDFKAQVEEHFGGREFAEAHLETMFSSYSRGGNLVQSFALMLNKIMPDMGLVIFCPHNTDVKTMSKSFFKEIIERHFTVKENLLETENSLTADGYHIQAVKKETATHLFYHGPQRKAIHYLDDSFQVADKKLGLSGMLDMIDKYPEQFSPDVLTRPVWQSFLFPVAAQTGGPSEIAYFCQIGKLFELFSVAQPYYYSRVNATIVEKRQQELLDKFNIEFNELTDDVEKLVNRLTTDSFPKDLEDKISEFKTHIKNEFDNFSEHVIDFEKSMEPMLKQTFGKIDFAVGNLEGKIFNQFKKKMDTVRQKIYRLETALYPNKSFQERSLSANYFISKYGPGIIDFIISRLDVGNDNHQLIYLSEYNS